jgi:hypothetical protein
MESAVSSTRWRTLALSLDATKYGTFAETGGGAEVARSCVLGSASIR